jgi:hypothetical protein
MKKLLTVHRWNSNPWKLYELVFIAYASVWQIVSAPSAALASLSASNMAGSIILFVALHLRDRTASRNVERWAYLALIWSMGWYLTLALAQEGWIGLIRQTNLGVVLVMGIILGSLHRAIFLSLRGRINRRRINREARNLLECSIDYDED